MQVSAGRRLGPYEVVGLLGAGGMGVVYRARDPRLGREVAVKVLPEEMSLDPRRFERFDREARAVAALSHPNILSVHDVGNESGTPYVVFELLDGQTLRERLAAGPLPVRVALDLAAQVARGLAAAHRQGIVHRDIKPENLLVARGGLLKILDFGLAKALAPEGRGPGDETASRPTQTGGPPGTPAYMSPEQVAGQAVDPRSDLFSLGVVVHEMLSGASPFRRDTAAETMTAILRESPTPLASAVAAEAPGLGPLLDRCLAKDPDERFQSAADLEFALRQALGPASPAPAAVTSRSPFRWFLRAGGGVALGVAAVLAAVLFWGPPAARAPTFVRLTFRRGTIWSARFAPDGETVVYSAAWGGRPVELFETRVGSTESRPLKLGAANVLSISSRREMALSLDPTFVFTFPHPGTLARAALAGGAPREMARDVDSADWMPDGRAIVFSRGIGEKERLELSSGRVLYETNGTINHVRVSPDGRRFAFFEEQGSGPSLVVLDREGRKSVLSTGWRNWSVGLAWAPSGQEIWFTGTKSRIGASLYAVDLRGRERVVARVPGGLQLLDVFRDGRALLASVRIRNGLAYLPPGAARERDLSWLDATVLGDLSADARTVAFQELSPTGGWSVYVRDTDGSPAVHLGDGVDFGTAALSPDGRWVLAAASSPAPQLVLLPTGPGPTRRLAGVAPLGDQGLRWLPDGSGAVFLASKGGGETGAYVEYLAGGAIRRLAAGLARSGLLVTPDGRSVAAARPDGTLASYAIDGTGSRLLAGRYEGQLLLGWSPDGRSVYSYRMGDVPGKIYGTELATGRRTVWKELMPADPAGVWRIHPVRLTPDGRSYAYTYFRELCDLYVYEGLR